MKRRSWTTLASATSRMVGQRTSCHETCGKRKTASQCGRRPMRRSAAIVPLWSGAPAGGGGQRRSVATLSDTMDISLVSAADEMETTTTIDPPSPVQPEKEQPEPAPPPPASSSSSSVRNDPKLYWPMDTDLAPHIRACMYKVDFENGEIGCRDTDFSLCTLGTGSATGSINRCNSASVIKHSGKNCYLIDCGEGVQRQFLMSRMSVREVDKIFITHMHGDHVFGLPGLLLFLQVANLQANHPRNIEIYGPVGLYNYLTASLTLSGTEIKKLKVDVFELHGGTGRSMRSGANTKTFHEFKQRGINRRSIPQNADGTFTLCEPTEITTRELARTHRSKPQGLYVKAAEIDHVPNLQCFGYMFQEAFTQPRPLDVVKMQAAGVTDHKHFRELKAGFSVQVGDREVHADDVSFGPPPLPRKVTILGDCTFVPPPMEQLALDSDILVHEATLTMRDKGTKVTLGGHSTAAEAALLANKCRAKVLVLNHLPAKENAAETGLQEAVDVIRKDQTIVQVAFDHLEIMVPRGGFQLRKPAAKSLFESWASAADFFPSKPEST